MSEREKMIAVGPYDAMDPVPQPRTAEPLADADADADNDLADVDVYTRTIRDWLGSRQGQPPPRRAIADTYGTSSLISPSAQKVRRVPGAP